MLIHTLEFNADLEDLNKTFEGYSSDSDLEDDDDFQFGTHSSIGLDRDDGSPYL
jgi:hypothetical protein